MMRVDERTNEPSPARGRTPHESRRTLLESHLARLEAARDEVSRSPVRTRWLLLGVLSVIPAAALWGSIGALGAFLTAIAIVFMGRYVTWAHEQEYASQQEAVRQQLVALDETLVQGARERRRWRVEGKRVQL
jgi:hypothetical protein